jgi:hypothetical protein
LAQARIKAHAFHSGIPTQSKWARVAPEQVMLAVAFRIRRGAWIGRPRAHVRAYLEYPTIAYAVLGRLFQNSYRLALKGDSMRKHKATASAVKTVKGH